MRGGPTCSLKERGMTFIEIMIVVAIVGSMMALGATMMFPGPDQKLRNDASRLAGTIKYVFNEGVVQNKYYRIVFDLGQRSYRVESTTEPVFLTLKDSEQTSPPSIKSALPSEEEEGLAADLEEKAGMAQSGFSPESDNTLLRSTKLAKGIKFKDLIVLHAQGRQETGQVPVYFFPNGWVEPVTINLSDEDEEVFYSIEVNPLTGRSKIRATYLETNYEEFLSEES